MSRLEENRRKGTDTQSCFPVEQVRSGASPTASAPTGTLFVGWEMPVVSRPPAPNRKVPCVSKGYTHMICKTDHKAYHIKCIQGAWYTGILHEAGAML